MSWKQPIPTNLEETFGTDYRSSLLYRELIYRACNKDAVLTLDGKKHVQISRGQVLFGRHKFAKYVCGSSATVDRILMKLEKTYNLVSNQRNNNYTVVSILNYDELVSFEQPSEQPVSNQRATSEQPVSTSKSVKSVESEKNEIIYTKKYFKNNWKQILAECKTEFSSNPLYGARDFDKIMQDFLSGIEIKNYGYKNYKLAYLNWLRRSPKVENQPATSSAGYYKISF